MARDIYEAKKVFFEEIDSTNTFLKRAIVKGELSRAMVWSRRQTAGRGRMERSWLSPPGGLYMSLSTMIDDSISKPVFYTVLAGLATVELLRDDIGLEARLKWPNDVIVKGDKISGMLSELVDFPAGKQHIVVGIGLNVNAEISPSSLRHPATSIKQCLGHEVSVSDIRDKLGDRVFGYWNKAHTIDSSEILTRWSEFSEYNGKQVRIDTSKGSYMGLFLGVDKSFAMRLKCEDGERRFTEGDCQRLRTSENEGD